MKQVGIFEAKTHFSAIVEAAEHGHSTLITRKGKPVARISPVDGPKAREFGFDDGLGYIAADFDAPLPSDTQNSFDK